MNAQQACDERFDVVLGAGLAGLASAWRLSASSSRRVLLLEKEERVGGLAATIDALDQRFDLGSHRIHRSCDLQVLALIRSLCGERLRERARNGLIFVDGCFVRYPPTAVDLLCGLGPAKFMSFGAGFAAAQMRSLFSKSSRETFKSLTSSLPWGNLYTAHFTNPMPRSFGGFLPRK